MTNPDRRFDQLTEVQRRLLRKVAEGRSSKEMSREVGLEPGTIDVYLSQALKIIGSSDRRSAAAEFVAHEAAILNGSKLRSQTLAISNESAQRNGKRWLIELRALVSPPPVGGREHDYDLKGRLLTSFKVAVLGFVTIIALSMVISALFWIFPKN
jgi:DNA-binding CsgD family transcriptional regulator